jgi:hypothetical protein
MLGKEVNKAAQVYLKGIGPVRRFVRHVIDRTDGSAYRPIDLLMISFMTSLVPP